MQDATQEIEIISDLQKILERGMPARGACIKETLDAILRIFVITDFRDKAGVISYYFDLADRAIKENDPESAQQFAMRALQEMKEFWEEE